MSFGNDDDEMSDSVHSMSSSFQETSDDDMSKAGSVQPPPKKARVKRPDLGWRDVHHCADMEELLVYAALNYSCIRPEATSV